MIAIYVILALIVLMIFWVISLYNRLVRLRNNRENAFADIDVQLRMRHDLIPQLVESVRGYMKHESTVLSDVTNARANAMNATNINDKIQAEQQLTSALRGLQIAVEAYPDLKASTNFMQLQEEIADVENKLAAARRFFNSSTKELNVATQIFPSNIVASMFGFHKEMMFDLGDEGRKTMEAPPEIKF
jgi:LemA protein